MKISKLKNLQVFDCKECDGWAEYTVSLAFDIRFSLCKACLKKLATALEYIYQTGRDSVES